MWLTIISILMMLTGVLYMWVYIQKGKSQRQKDMGYKWIFGCVILVLSILLVGLIDMK